ncbi:hypothetical protein DL770_005849 [Monosporascus sp. CRB-9-2]|nr:hypothetical protein DL770_005849 [Monosporascus sp. CRB-9-2]
MAIPPMAPPDTPAAVAGSPVVSAVLAGDVWVVVIEDEAVWGVDVVAGDEGVEVEGADELALGNMVDVSRAVAARTVRSEKAISHRTFSSDMSLSLTQRVRRGQQACSVPSARLGQDTAFCRSHAEGMST